MSNTVNDSAIKKLKLLFTVVDRQKGEFYLDVISQFGVNCQIAMAGLGTATSELVELLGLEPHKAVILSVVREDMAVVVSDTLMAFDTSYCIILHEFSSLFITMDPNINATKYKGNE